MISVDPAKLEAVKQRVWFYRFDLPDGSQTRSDLPHAMVEVHATRARHLRRIIEQKVTQPKTRTAIDFASHEGFYSIELAKHFASVRGYEVRPESLAAARLITDVLAVSNIDYVAADLQTLSFSPAQAADFVLVYGLIYHMENPIHVLRLAAQLCTGHILVESQVFPYDVAGRIEDGCYEHQRAVQGVFALSPDYPQGREGGSTELALVPSLNALLFLLTTFGFVDLDVLSPEPGDYEQFRRGVRVMVYGRKASGAAG